VSNVVKEPVLVVEGLHVEVDGKEILKGVNLSVPKGEVHAVMGPNGSGKSTLANTLMGHPRYVVTQGRILFKGENVTQAPPDQRSLSGLFLASQYPTEIAGVTLINFLRQIVNARRTEEMPLVEFRRMVNEKMDQLGMDRAFATRYVNAGFSGGEKKRSEILQMAILRPEMAVLDETDSGLDIDALRIVSDGINRLLGPDMGVLLITHYTRILNYVKPHAVHVMMDGQIVRSGGPELAGALEEHGYDLIRQGAGSATA
jgi:Fe-S cluster assembly ATP-binding protein